MSRNITCNIRVFFFFLQFNKYKFDFRFNVQGQGYINDFFFVGQPTFTVAACTRGKKSFDVICLFFFTYSLTDLLNQFKTIFNSILTVLKIKRISEKKKSSLTLLKFKYNRYLYTLSAWQILFEGQRWGLNLSKALRVGTYYVFPHRIKLSKINNYLYTSNKHRLPSTRILLQCFAVNTKNERYCCYSRDNITF